MNSTIVGDVRFDPLRDAEDLFRLDCGEQEGENAFLI